MDVRCVQYHSPCCFSLRSWWCYSWSHRTGRSLPIRLRTSAYSFRCPFRLRELQACEPPPQNRPHRRQSVLSLSSNLEPHLRYHQSQPPRALPCTLYLAPGTLLMTPETLTALLTPYATVTPSLASQLLTYLDLILKWNARFNLTAIRTPEDIVRRHFGESLFAAAHLGPCATLLDYGSGAGFPGLPTQLLRPDVQVTLAESRAKKAA